MASDRFRELRSMILLELCCPPLPMLAIRQETGSQTLTNTHDLMSVLMIAAFRRQDGIENSRRKAMQHAINRVYRDGLERCKTFAQAYTLMTAFMTEYLATYLLPGSGYTKADIRILPAEYISQTLQALIRSYCTALRTIADLEPLGSANHRVDSLLMDCVHSAVHKQQQRIVGVPVLEGVGEGVGEEGHDPQAFEPRVEVL